MDSSKSSVFAFFPCEISDRQGSEGYITHPPLFVLYFPAPLTHSGIDSHRSSPLFASASSVVQIYDLSRSTPLSSLPFGNSQETVTKVKFNQSEVNVLASVGGDRTMCLFDVRTGKAERRVVMAVSISH